LLVSSWHSSLCFQRVPWDPLFFRLQPARAAADNRAVKLVAISAQDLPLDRALPFALRDAHGRMLLGAGVVLADAAQREALRSTTLYAEEHQCAEWRRRVAQAMDQRLRQGVALKDVVRARAEDAAQGATLKPPSTAETWLDLRGRLDAAVRDVRAGSDWLPRVREVQQRALALADKRFDQVLFHLVHEAEHHSEKYAAQHALMCLVLAEHTAAALGWSVARRQALGLAALTMNVAMFRLQDQLAVSQLPPTPEQRREIDQHPARGAAQLQAAGLAEPLVLEVVARHHQDPLPGAVLDSRPEAEQLALLLRRIDIYGSRISRRESRPAQTPLLAAREVCLGADGTPDTIGGALLKTVGLYPPGSFVELASGETAVVVARGRRANLPLVAALLSASGSVFAEPLLRDTLERRHAVKAAVPPARVKVRFSHDKVLGLVGGVGRLH
jgi:hypothetical protein